MSAGPVTLSPVNRRLEEHGKDVTRFGRPRVPTFSLPRRRPGPFAARPGPVASFRESRHREAMAVVGSHGRYERDHLTRAPLLRTTFGVQPHGRRTDGRRVGGGGRWPRSGRLPRLRGRRARSLRRRCPGPGGDLPTRSTRPRERRSGQPGDRLVCGLGIPAPDGTDPEVDDHTAPPARPPTPATASASAAACTKVRRCEVGVRHLARRRTPTRRSAAPEMAGSPTLVDVGDPASSVRRDIAPPSAGTESTRSEAVAVISGAGRCPARRQAVSVRVPGSPVVWAGGGAPERPNPTSRAVRV